MKVELEIISTEIIKPSSPTPDHLRHYQLSFLDQTSPKAYNPFVYFYELNEKSNITEISNKIKNSLSEVLTLYFPLAGRVNEDRFIDCNDEGVSYSFARVSSTCPLSDVIKNPIPTELCKLLPFDLFQLNEFPLGVQLNVFACGGIAIGLCMSHQLTDALSCLMFVKTWVAISRVEADQESLLARPRFVSATLFPPKDDPGYNSSAAITRDVLTKRFVFNAAAIEAIRSKYDQERTTLGSESDDDHQIKRTSRVEALSAFLWGRFVAVTRGQLSAQSEKAYVVVPVVNLRARFDSPLSDYTFGNLSRCGFAKFEGEEEGFEVVEEIRKGIRKVNSDYLRRMQRGEDVHLDLIGQTAQNVMMKGGDLITFVFTSLCRFPLYEADFGWGEPTWVSAASMCLNNLVAFLDSKSGDGIEAYIALNEVHMAMLEADQDFIRAISQGK